MKRRTANQKKCHQLASRNSSDHAKYAEALIPFLK
jgi:hypothetical protein